MDNDFPQESEFEPLTSIFNDDIEIKEAIARAIENCIDTPKPHCFLKYYELLAMYLFQKKLYDKAFIMAEKGLKDSCNLYKKLYPDVPNGYFDNPVSAFSHEHGLLVYGGKASEKCKSIQDSASFYESYSKNGHWVGSIIYAAERAAKMYKKLDDKNKAISCLEYILEKIQVPSNTKSFFENEINILEGGNNIEWPKDHTLFIKDDGIYAKANEYSLFLSKIKYEIPELKVAYYFMSKDRNVFKTENVFWWATQALLYYEEIYTATG